MIQRYLFNILEGGLQEFKSNPRLVEDIFSQQYSLRTTEVAAILEYFDEHPPEIVNGYARQDTEFPAIAVVLGSEAETEDFLGYAAEPDLDPDSDTYQADIQAAIWDHTHLIISYADHPDVCQWYYEMAKTILWNGIPTLEAYGMAQFSMSGQELAPDPRYLPEHLFVRQLAFKASREWQVVLRDSLVQKAFQVSGIHIDSSGSPRDVGGVKTLVTPYSEGDDG